MEAGPPARARSTPGPALERFRALEAKADRSTAEQRKLDLLQLATDHPDPVRGRERATVFLDRGFAIDRVCSALLDRELEALDPDEQARRCARLDLPVLIIDGDADPRPRAAMDGLAAALPRVRRSTIRGAGHFPWLDDPDGVRSAVGAWLRGLRLG